MIRSALLAALLSLAALVPARAQHAAPPLSALRLQASAAAPAVYAPPLQESGPAASGAMLVLGGIAGGGPGLFGGAALGYAIETGLTGCEGGDWCGIFGAFGGGLLGELVMLPLGVHLANGRRGSYGWTFAASTLAAGAGGLLSTGFGDADFMMFVVPALQIYAAVAVQKRTARVRRRREIDRAPAVP